MPDEKEFARWEQLAIKEVEKISSLTPDKEFMLLMIAGRELCAYGLKEKSIEYYLKAYNHPSQLDKSESVIQLVSLNLQNKTELKKALDRSRDWFNKNPSKLTSEIDSWLKMIEGYLNGKTPIEKKQYFSIWATDSRVDELMNEGLAEEALKILGPKDLKYSNINIKIRQDILNTSVLGKKSPPLWCQSTLKDYPTSLTWTMRVCRYLKGFRENKKSNETLESISIQMKFEKTPHVTWLKVLEKIK